MQDRTALARGGAISAAGPPGFGQTVRAPRSLALTIHVGAAEVVAAFGCSRSAAYRHLRAASGRTAGTGAMLRVDLDSWETYARRIHSCRSEVASTAGTTRTSG